MAQLMLLPLTVSCFSEIQINFTFLVPAHPGSPGKRAVKRMCVCVVCANFISDQGRENCLEGLTFVITGVFESIDREETKALILKHSGKVTNNVTRMTRYLVAGRDCGQSKLNKVCDVYNGHSV